MSKVRIINEISDIEVIKSKSDNQHYVEFKIDGESVRLHTSTLSKFVSQSQAPHNCACDLNHSGETLYQLEIREVE